MKGNIYLITQFLSKMVSKHNCVLFRVAKKNQKAWGVAILPTPLQTPLWRSGARGQLGLRIKRGFVNWTKPFFFLFLSSRFFYSSLIIAGQSLGLCHFDAELSVARNPKPCSVIITTLIKPFY